MTSSVWLLISYVIPLIGGIIGWGIRDFTFARRWVLGTTFLTAICSTVAWLLFDPSTSTEAGIPWLPWIRESWYSIDQLSAPLGPLVAVVYFATALVTVRTKMRRFSVARMLLSEMLTLATLGNQDPWGIVLLLSLGTLPPLFEMGARGSSKRVYLFHMGLFVILMVLGQMLEDFEGDERYNQWWASLPLLAAVLIRGGAFPFHTWVRDHFQQVSFSSAILFVTPMLGAYACVRLVIPVAPDWVLRGIALLSLFTALYSAGLAVVQIEARNLFCMLFLSHASLVLVGLEIVTEIGLTGALCIWLSVGLSLAGFGLTLRAIESRHGQVGFAKLLGLYDQAPELAVCFILTGLACVGFPGTIGFVGTELLVDGIVESYPLTGTTVVIASALNGIAIIRAYFRIFSGPRHLTTISLRIRKREHLAVLLLATLILGGGLIPQPGVASRYSAADELLKHRNRLLIDSSVPTSHSMDQHESK